MNIKLTLAYDGTDFLGWQKTSEGRSVEEELLNVLQKILQEPIELQAASRTDARVHALGQVVNFHVQKEIPDFGQFQLSMNQLLPKDIAVLEVSIMPENFHPTLDCSKKIYHYFLCWDTIQLPHHRFYSWHYPHQLNIENMRKAASKLIGEHDFAAFCNSKKNEAYDHTIRTLHRITIAEITNKNLRIELEGNHFLYKMARNIVGTLVYVGQGKILVEDVMKILESKDRTKAGMTAPAQGLFLHSIMY